MTTEASPPSSGADDDALPAEAEAPRTSPLQDLLQEYGGIALGIYFSTTLIVGLPLGYGIGATLDTSGWAYWGAVLGGAWVGLKASQVPRMALTAFLTPVVARVLRAKGSAEPAKSPAQAGEEPAAEA